YPLAPRGLAQLTVILDAAVLDDQPPPVARVHEPGGDVMHSEQLEQADAVRRARGPGNRKDDGELAHWGLRRSGVSLGPALPPPPPPVTTTMTPAHSPAVGPNPSGTPPAVSATRTPAPPRRRE